MLRKNDGFTLIEIAIVLTIMGLLVGGVILAKDMIRSAQVLAVIDEVNNYKQAIKIFQDKYQYLPGDMPTAETFWGSDPGGCPNTTYTATPHTATCNGNGDGHIGYSSMINGCGWQYTNEVGRAWQQLSNAGLIKGTYNGISGAGGGVAGCGYPVFVALPGINVPASQLSGGGYTLWYEFDPVIIPLGAYTNQVGHIIEFGTAVANSTTYGPILTAAEGFAIDTKIDDGLPAFGNVRSMNHAFTPNCVNNSDNTPAGAAYLGGSSSAPACTLFFITGF